MEFNFEQMFGIPESAIKPVCVLTPFLTKPLIHAFALKNRFKGKPYAGFSLPDLTFIETRMGPLFTGDAVLNLGESLCRSVIFIGSCGTLNEEFFPVGSLTSISAAYAMESFSRLCAEGPHFDQNIPCRPDPNLSMLSADIPGAQCASIGSLALETQFAPLFREKEIAVLDMECASVFSAAARAGLHAHAILYVTDVVGLTSPYEISRMQDIQSIKTAQKQIAEHILTALQNAT